MPVVGLFGSLQGGESIEREGVSGRLGPIPLILREMPSPERKRTRRIVDDDEDEEDDEDDEI